MTKSINGTASIREVYEISQRLENKIDKIETRVASIEGKASLIALIWSSIISIIGITVGIWIKRS